MKTISVILKLLEKEKKKHLRLLKNQGLKCLKQLARELFKENPLIQGFKWQQYTPYFNDGEPCIFRLTDAKILLTDGFLSTLEEEERQCFSDNFSEDGCGIWQFRYEKLKNTPHKKQIKSLLNAISVFNNFLGRLQDSVELAFGDNREITITRKKIKVEDYSQHS